MHSLGNGPRGSKISAVAWLLLTHAHVCSLGCTGSRDIGSTSCAEVCDDYPPALLTWNRIWFQALPNSGHAWPCVKLGTWFPSSFGSTFDTSLHGTGVFQLHQGQPMEINRLEEWNSLILRSSQGVPVVGGPRNAWLSVGVPYKKAHTHTYINLPGSPSSALLLTFLGEKFPY